MMTKTKSVIPQDNHVIRIFAIYQAMLEIESLNRDPVGTL